MTLSLTLSPPHQLYDSTSETSQRAAVLRRGVLPLLAVFKVQPKQCRMFIKKLVSVWASGHPKLRVLVLIAIFRLVKMMGPDLLDYTCKVSLSLPNIVDYSR